MCGLTIKVYFSSVASHLLQVGVSKDSVPHSNSVLAPWCFFFIKLIVGEERTQVCFFAENTRSLRDIYTG